MSELASRQCGRPDLKLHPRSQARGRTLDRVWIGLHRRSLGGGSGSEATCRPGSPREEGSCWGPSTRAAPQERVLVAAAALQWCLLPSSLHRVLRLAQRVLRSAGTAVARVLRYDCSAPSVRIHPWAGCREWHQSTFDEWSRDAGWPGLKRSPWARGSLGLLEGRRHGGGAPRQVQRELALAHAWGARHRVSRMAGPRGSRSGTCGLPAECLQRACMCGRLSAIHPSLVQAVPSSGVHVEGTCGRREEVLCQASGRWSGQATVLGPMRGVRSVGSPSPEAAASAWGGWGCSSQG